MIKIENVNTYGWEAAIRGMRNPLNSWDKSDSAYCNGSGALCDTCSLNPGDWEPCFFALEEKGRRFVIGSEDLKLAKKLISTGTDHSKFMRMIGITMDITAPLYWWKEFDTYKIGTVANSCSTMHKIADKEFTLDDFSCEHLLAEDCCADEMYDLVESDGYEAARTPIDFMQLTISVLNHYRQKYLTAKIKPFKEEAKRKDVVKNYWWQMIQLLPSSYNQKRTVSLNYAVARNQYHARKYHKLDEWRIYCDFLETLPYSELITMSKK